jgi:hypothetical protein
MSGGLTGGPSKGAQATAGGGVSPWQQALTQYNFGQNEVAAGNQFAQTPMSTMKTQADTGAFATQAQQLAQMSDQDATAVANAINQQVQQQTAGLGNLAESVGGAFGSGTGGDIGGG